jgi:hypothetical protein
MLFITQTQSGVVDKEQRTERRTGFNTDWSMLLTGLNRSFLRVASYWPLMPPSLSRFSFTGIGNFHGSMPHDSLSRGRFGGLVYSRIIAYSLAPSMTPAHFRGLPLRHIPIA